MKGRRSAEWNAYRKRNPGWIPDLMGGNLYDVLFVPPGLPEFDLSGALFINTRFPEHRSFLMDRDRQVNIKGAFFDAETKFPLEFDPILAGAKFVTKAEAAGIMTEPPIVFISYAWADEDVVLAIDQWLRLKRVSTRMDRRDFFAGSRIHEEIIRVMQDCNVVVIMYSEKAKDKPWPQFERELAADLEMDAKSQGKKPPRIIYVVADNAAFSSVTEPMRLAITAKGKRFDLVCEEIYHSILQLPKEADQIDLAKWKDYIF